MEQIIGDRDYIPVSCSSKVFWNTCRISLVVKDMQNNTKVGVFIMVVMNFNCIYRREEFLLNFNKDEAIFLYAIFFNYM